MKRIYLIIPALLLSTILMAQVRAIVYKQTTLPGAAQGRVPVENGQAVPVDAKPMTSWYIYVQYDDNIPFKPYCIWLEGKAHKLRTEAVKGPVIIKSRDLHRQVVSDTVLTAHEGKIVQLFPLDTLSAKKARENGKPEEVRIDYYLNGKKKYLLVKDVKKMPPVHLQ